MKPKLLLLEDFDNLESKKKLSEYVELVYPESEDANINVVDGIYVKLDNLELDEKKNLKFVATPCTNTDHVKVPDGVKVIHLDQEFKDGVGQQVTSTAEHTLSLMLQLAKKKGVQLSGKTLGVIGLGRIGGLVARCAKFLGMDVLTYDIKDRQIRTVFGTHVGDLTDEEMEENKLELIEQSDVIVISCTSDESAKGMIDKKQIEMMKDGAIIVNTARQEIVDVYEIKSALYRGDIYYADDFKDQFDFEDMAIQTPHIGGKTHEGRMITDMYIADKIIQEIKGGK